MTYIPHLRTVTTFDIGPPGSPKETASCSLSWMPSHSAAMDLQGITNQMYGSWADWIILGSAGVCSHVSLRQVKSSLVGTDGHMIGEPYVKVSTGTAPAGTNSGNFHPWQVSTCLTLVCGAGGKGRFGRIYLPPMSFPVTSLGLIGDPAHSQIFGALQTLMQNMSDHAGIGEVDFGLAVAGKTGSGTLRRVTQLRFGKVADTQRRRRRSLDEAYVAADFAG